MKKRLKKSAKSASSIAATSFLLIALALALVLTGCARPALRQAASLPEADLLLKKIDENNRRVARFAVRGRWNYQAPRNNQKAGFTLAASLPDQFRAIITDPFGRTALTLAAQGGALKVLDHKEARLYFGPTDLCLKKCFLPLGMDLSEFLGLLTGGCPVWPHREARVFQDSDGLIRLVLLSSEACSDAGCQEEILLDPTDLLPRQVRLLDPDGQTLKQVVYTDYRQADGGVAPFEIAFNDEVAGVSLKVSYDEVRLNLDLAETLFTLEAPPGVSTREICRNPDEPCR